MPELVNGLGGQQGYGAGSLPTNGPANDGTDDESTGAIDITPIVQNGLNYFAQIYTSLFVNNNGNVTFGQASDEYTPSHLNGDYDGVPIIAPFFADVDTRSPLSGVTTYGTGTVDGHDAFIATWPGVG